MAATRTQRPPFMAADMDKKGRPSMAADRDKEKGQPSRLPFLYDSLWE